MLWPIKTSQFYPAASPARGGITVAHGASRGKRTTGSPFPFRKVVIAPGRDNNLSEGVWDAMVDHHTPGSRPGLRLYRSCRSSRNHDLDYV